VVIEQGASDICDGLNICDAHHHLWDLGAIRYPWLNAPKGTRRFFGDPTAIQKNYLVTDFQADIDRLPVIQSVHIQVGAAADQHLAETAWVQSQIDSGGLSLPDAMVAYAALESADLAQVLDDIQVFSGVRGIRQIIGRAAEEDRQTGSGLLLANKRWQAGLLELEKRSLSFDLQLIPSQMNAAFEVFSRVETLPVALCHCGSPWFLNEKYRSSESFSLWKQGMQKLATLPNMHCKISGLSMFTQQWRLDDVKLIMEIALDVFGLDRCMFGSNFPVDKLYVSYQDIWQTYLRLTEHIAIAERQKLFGENGRRFYRLATNAP